MNMTQITALVEAIVSAAPAIEQGIVSITPYVQAIVTMIENGGNPSDAQWAALQSALDAGSAALAAQAKEAEGELAGEAAAAGGAA